MNNIMRIVINNIFSIYARVMSVSVFEYCALYRHKIDSATCRRTACPHVLCRNVVAM